MSCNKVIANTYIDLPHNMHEMNVGQSSQPPDPRKKKDSLWRERRLTNRQTKITKLIDFILLILMSVIKSAKFSKSILQKVINYYQRLFCVTHRKYLF